MPEGTTGGRRCHAEEALLHNWSGLPGRGPCVKAFFGNTHFFRPPDDGWQRHPHLVLVLQDLFDITVVVKPRRIALVPDDRGLFFQLLNYLGFRFGINPPRRCLAGVLQRKTLWPVPVKLQQLEELTPSNLEHGRCLIDSDLPC